MDVTITNAGGRIEIVDLRNDLTNNYDVLKDGLRLFNIGNIVRITFINQTKIEINYDEVELINGATSVFPISGSDFLNELNVILGDYGTGGGGGIGTLQEVTDLGNTTDNNIEFTNAGLLFDNGAKFKKGTTDGGLGGAKGVAQICSIDYELKWEAGRLYVMEQNGFTIREVRYTFASIPNEFDDNTKGYVIGSRWVLDNGNLYTCTDATTNAAVWVLETLGGGDMYKSVYDTDNDGVVDKAETVQIIVRNSTGATLTKGQIVYLSGATGNRPNAVLAQANAEATSSKTIGWVFANISNNSDGYVCVSGSQHDLDTSALSAGDALWLSPTVAGGITSTLPVQPNHAVFIGYCARSHPTQGRIVFKIQNGYELQELHNILITSVANNEGLFYESSTSLWKNKTIATALGFTPEDSANKSTSVSTDSSSNIKFPSVKAVYDWAIVAFTTTAAVASQITTALTGYATQSWVNAQGFLTAITSGQITTALGFTPVTNARSISTTSPLLGGGDLTANRTFSIQVASSSQNGYLSSSDWSVFNNKALNYKNTVDTAGYSGVTNTAVYTQLIPANKFASGDIIRILYRTKKTNTNGSQTIRIYVNATADLSGTPILIATYVNAGAITFLTNQIQRHLVIKSNTNNTEMFLAAGTAVASDFGLYNGLTTSLIDWTLDRYFVFAIQNSNATDVNYGSMYLIEKL